MNFLLTAYKAIARVNLMKRIGPQMLRAIEITKSNPGCTKLFIARQIAPHGTGIQYGYNAINRAIKAGQIQVKLTDRGWYELNAN